MMRPLSKLLGAVVVLTLGLTACGGPVEPPGQTAKSSLARITAKAPTDDVTLAVRGNTDFGLKLFRALDEKGNLFVSPQSVTTALAMTMPGARGATATAFETSLELGLPQDRFHRAMNDLDQQLESRGKNAKGADDQPFRLSQTNQFFAQQGYAFEQPYLDLLAQEYGAGGRLLDFARSPEPSRLAINDWVEKKTENRIEDLLGEGTIVADTRLVLVNATYFNASWLERFQKTATADGAFHAPGGDVTVPLMHSSDVVKKAATVDGVEVVQLPYDGNELSLLALLPKGGDLQGLEQSLTAAKLEQYVAALKPEGIDLTFPKFTIDGETVSLKEPLTKLGLGIIFGAPDFSGITKTEPLYVEDVLHQTFVKLDENGTEAAAATAVILNRETSIPQVRPVAFDRPFLFLVRDDATGAVLFVGRIVSPKI